MKQNRKNPSRLQQRGVSMLPPRALNAAGKGALLLAGSGWGGGRPKTGSRWPALCRRTLAWSSTLVLCSLEEECLLSRPWGGDVRRIPGCSLLLHLHGLAVRVLVCAHAPPPLSSSVPLFAPFLSAFHMFSRSRAIIHVCLRLNYSLKVSVSASDMKIFQICK